MAFCRSCGARIIWAETVSGRRMPLDWYPDAAGAMVASGQLSDDGTPIYKALIDREDPPTGVSRHTSHFATCPQADDWRRG